jgi:very-short-patch-repair endonuclease
MKIEIGKYMQLKVYARNMRRNMTPEERKVWYEILLNLPVRFTRQKIIYCYIADFYCAEAKLIIEIDGRQHTHEEEMLYDRDRTQYFFEHGYTVLRISNKDVRKDICYVEELIRKALTSKLHRDFMSGMKD